MGVKAMRRHPSFKRSISAIPVDEVRKIQLNRARVVALRNRKDVENQEKWWYETITGGSFVIKIGNIKTGLVTCTVLIEFSLSYVEHDTGVKNTLIQTCEIVVPLEGGVSSRLDASKYLYECLPIERVPQDWWKHV